MMTNAPGYSIEFFLQVTERGQVYSYNGDKYIHWDNKLSLDWEREPGQFFFRSKLNGKLTIVGAAAESVVNMDTDTYAMITLVERLVQAPGGMQVEPFTATRYFRFSKSACNIKSETIKPYGTVNTEYRYIVEVTPEPVDEYTDILNNMEKEYDLIKLMTPKTRMVYSRRPCLQLFIRNTDYLGHFLGGNYWETEVSDSSSVLTTNKRFTRVFAFRNIHITSDIPAPVGINPEGDYYGDFTNPPSSSSSSATNYYLYKNNDISTGKALHIFLWGGQNNQTLEINFAENYGTVANPYWMDVFTIVKGQNAPNGYDFFEYGSPNTILSGRVVNYVTDDSRVTAVQTEKEYYARWYLPTSVFGSRTTYEKPTDDPTASGDIISYKYIAPALTSDVQVVMGIQNTEQSQWGQNDFGEYFHPPGNDNSYAPLLRSSWDNVSFWILRSSFSSTVEATGRETIVINEAYSLTTVLKYLFEAARTNGNSNYPRYDIEWKYGPAHANNIRVTPKSNIVRGPYSLAAQKAPTTLKDFLDLVKDLYNVYWRIDTDRNVIVMNTRDNLTDHEGYYPDLREPTGEQNPRNGRVYSYGSHAVQFERSELPERQQFKWMDRSTDLFNYPILVNNGAFVKPDDTDEVSFNNFTADFDFMIISGNECSLDGFAIAHVESATNVVPIYGVTYLGAFYYINNPQLTLADIVADGLTAGINQERPTESYNFLYDLTGIPREATLAYTATQQMGVPIPIIHTQGHSESLLNPGLYNNSRLYRFVRTNYGLGRIRKMSVNLSSRWATLTIEQRPK